MRNKGFFWSITIALALACIYQLSFTFATNRVENDAEEFAEAKLDSLYNSNTEFIELGQGKLYLSKPADSSELINIYKGQYLKSKMNEKIHFTGYTYAQCKENEINLGLDLKGGMSATLEISVPELVASLAGNTRNLAFKNAYDAANEKTNNGDGNFVENFVAAYSDSNPNTPIAKIFHMHNPDQIASDASDEAVIAFLNEQADNALDGVEIIIEKRVNQFGVAQPTIQKQSGSNRIFVELPGVSDKASVRNKLQATANLEFYEVYDNALGFSNIILNKEADLAKELNGESVQEEPIVSDTLTEPTVADSGATNLLSETIDSAKSEVNELLSGDNDLLSGDNNLLEDGAAETTETADSTKTRAELEKKYPISAFLTFAFAYDETGQPIGFQEGSQIGYANVRDTAILNARLRHEIIRSALPPDMVLMWDAKELPGQDQPIVSLHAIKVPEDGPRVDGKDIDYAALDDSQIGKYGVRMVMNKIGASKWLEMTTDNYQKQVAITMDGFVYSAPVVQSKMDYTSSITGNFTMAEAKDLAGLLNAGALPAPVKIVDESVVGASLGQENISAGIWSFILALMIVLVYMVFYYNKAGLIADAALVINIFLLIGALASLKAILTLPGIAGIVLTIGMSVDANVLIFERIREESRNGKGLKAAIKEGYSKALSAILDANITTLLTGIVLATFGTGPIKGFATTLIIGIFTSFFAAVVITRLIVMAFVERDKKVQFSTRITENWFTKNNVQFVKKRKMFYLVSGAIIIAGVASLLTRGLDYGVDFAGGRQYKVVFHDQTADYEGLKKILTTEFDGNEPGVKMVDNTSTALITTKYKIEDSSEEVDSLIEVKLLNGIADFGESEITESKKIAPTISKDLKTNSFYAIGVSLLVIFLYIVFRFRRWQYGLGALIAMAHDVMVVLAIFSIFHGFLGFSMEIDQAFIAAILTVVGYSINDTVVVFDRIREYLGVYTKKDQKEVINMALNSTLGRTVNTSVSTFIVLFIIFLFGGSSIQGFVFALMVGVVVGTYSSLFIATPAVIDLSKKEEKK